ncbi:hypothetical protein Lal_00033845 [Lupinus albus]|nr:hypothetical protein Lal_00033845 [Lupinus albus]
MGFIIIGIGSLSDTGLNGAILQVISLGFIDATLFFLARNGYDRLRLLYLEEMGGMAIPMPKIFTIFSIFSMASLALLGMSGFVAEFLIFFGIITSQKYLLMTKILINFCACQEEHFGKLSLYDLVLMRTTCANMSLKIINKSTCLSLPFGILLRLD